MVNNRRFLSLAIVVQSHTDSTAMVPVVLADYLLAIIDQPRTH